LAIRSAAFGFICRRDSRPRGSGLGKSPELKQTGFQILVAFPPK
jgi:hypothetical protein